MAPHVWLVIPTYNEAAGIERLVRAAAAELGRVAPGRHHILVVDDNSPDGTGAVLDGLAEELDVLEVLHRAGKAGLGRAYLAGFDRALAAGADVIVQMDADYSHDPAYLGPMLDALESCDMVLGSRYVPGGGVADWDWLRRVISRGGCLYARRVLNVPIRDLTGGFKAHRRSVLESLDLPSVGSEGYAFQIEITYRALLRGFRVREMPIVFADRSQGDSKMSARIALEAMSLVPRMRQTARPTAIVAPPVPPAALDGVAGGEAARQPSTTSP
jgi:dolichol-phosphate mannosyltransferase